MPEHVPCFPRQKEEAEVICILYSTREEEEKKKRERFSHSPIVNYTPQKLTIRGVQKSI